MYKRQLEGLSQLITTIKTIKKKLNPQIEIEGVLGTMYDGRTNLSIQVLDEVKKYFPDKVYKTIIPRNVRLSESPSFGEPIINYDRTSKGADAYICLLYTSSSNFSISYNRPYTRFR